MTTFNICMRCEQLVPQLTSLVISDILLCERCYRNTAGFIHPLRNTTRIHYQTRITGSGRSMQRISVSPSSGLLRLPHIPNEIYETRLSTNRSNEDNIAEETDLSGRGYLRSGSYVHRPTPNLNFYLPINSSVNRRKKSAQAQPPKRICQVCQEDFSNQQIRSEKNPSCKHDQQSVCSSCVYQHIWHTFNAVLAESVNCPESNCQARLEYDVVKRIIFNHGDKTLFDRYDQFLFQQQIERMKDFIWCAHGCGSGQLNDDGGHSRIIVTCIKCNKRTCFRHKTVYHDGLSCRQFDNQVNRDHQASLTWLAQNTKKCPQCPFEIEKNGGCDHMTCSRCRYEFCWSCLTDYEIIRNEGSHRHDPYCKHYAPVHEPEGRNRQTPARQEIQASTNRLTVRFERLRRPSIRSPETVINQRNHPELVATARHTRQYFQDSDSDNDGD